MRLLKNKTAEDLKLDDMDPGIVVAANSEEDLSVNWQPWQLTASAQLIEAIGQGVDKYQLNDGTNDLSVSDAINLLRGISEPMPLSSMGNIPVETLKPTGGGLIRASHDFCDPCTWYGDSVRVVDEVLGCPSHDGIHFRSDFKNWIDLTHGRVTRENDILNNTTAYTNGPFSVTVKVNGVEKIEGVDYIVDYLHGEISFSWPNYYSCEHETGMGAVAPDAVVTATYNYAHGSTWYLKPTPGKILLISDTEIQFSQGVIMIEDIEFAPWINHPLYGWMPVPGETVVYKSMKDFLNEGNKGTGTIQPIGGTKRGLRYPASVFPFDYLSNKAFPSSLSAELRVNIHRDIPVDGEFGTVTCYCRETDDPDYVS